VNTVNAYRNLKSYYFQARNCRSKIIPLPSQSDLLQGTRRSFIKVLDVPAIKLAFQLVACGKNEVEQ